MELAESNGSLLPDLWLTSPAGWLPRTGISCVTLCSVIEYGLPFNIYHKIWRHLHRVRFQLQKTYCLGFKVSCQSGVSADALIGNTRSVMMLSITGAFSLWFHANNLAYGYWKMQFKVYVCFPALWAMSRFFGIFAHYTILSCGWATGG